MASDAARLAELLSSRRWEIRQILLSYDMPHREHNGALDVASVKLDGDLVDIGFSCAEYPGLVWRLRIWAPRGLTTFDDQPDAFRIDTAERILWDDREIKLHEARPMIDVN